MTSENRSRRPEALVDVVFETAADLANAGRSFLASEQGRQLRRRLAAGIIIGAPIVSELPIFRRTIVGRLLRTAAVGTLIIKGAEWVRDWQPVVSVIEQSPAG